MLPQMVAPAHTELSCSRKMNVRRSLQLLPTHFPSVVTLSCAAGEAEYFLFVSVCLCVCPRSFQTNTLGI